MNRIRQKQPGCHSRLLVLLVAVTFTPLALPGQALLNAGQHKLFLSCTGQRHGPVVIFEAGQGRSSEDWSKVQPEAAKITESCSYDRVGLGRSAPASPVAGAPAETTDEQVKDLYQLLHSASVRPPYIMVGHSFGGILVRRFATKYPGEIVGMVLLDSAHEEQIWRFLDIDPNSLQGISLKPDDLRREGFLPPRERLSWHADIPLIALQHGRSLPMEGPAKQHQAEFESAMQSMQKDLVARSRYGELRTAEHSGHFIQLEQPDVVVQAIEDVWNRSFTPKASAVRK
jgi:pimeloyl-ACP methyl ester carboxylesterase